MLADACRIRILVTCPSLQVNDATDNIAKRQLILSCQGMRMPILGSRFHEVCPLCTSGTVVVSL